MWIEIKILNKEFYYTKVKGGVGVGKDVDRYKFPSYATQGSAAIDLICTEDIVIYPGEVKEIRTGLAVWIGNGCKNYPASVGYVDSHAAALILPRSGLGTKGLVLANAVGLIDEDYQGELIVQAWNRNPHITSNYQDPRIFRLKAGDRFAQLMFVPVIKAEWEIVDEFSNTTDRGEDGFGSTGE